MLNNAPMNTPEHQSQLFPVLEPGRRGNLCVDARHTLYWEESGNPAGIPVLFLHGGPGGGASPQFRRFFDPASYRIILFDQRGAGQSTPAGEHRDNTTQLLIEDIECLRQWFGIAQWLVFGGSWGATLALAYGQAHPQRCLGFVLRSVFLCTKTEIDWFLYGGEIFHPELHAEFVAPIPGGERGDLLQAYVKRLFGDDPAQALSAARSWRDYERRRSALLPYQQASVPDTPDSDAHALSLARLEAHYMRHQGFLEDDQLIRDMHRIAHLPAIIVQGRYDVLCPPVTAFRVLRAYPGASLHMVADAGHTAFEPGMVAALVAATEQFKLLGCF
jgi:proline iminopeptidase